MYSESISLTHHRITVLLIDDQSIIGQAIQHILLSETDIGFYYCQDPTLAIQQANQIQPTVILQDLVMPEIDGLSLVRYIRANPTTAHVPLIVLSSKEEADIKAQAFALGANDYMVKLPDKLEVIARIRYHSTAYINFLERNEAIKELEKANRLIRSTFGRYLSDDIVDTILESPGGMNLGGEKRVVTVMMTDLRGFTAITERLPAESVVAIINNYLEVMTEIILRYQGTIDEFIGDAILAIFGAPIKREDDAQRAVACALEMQLAMSEVNERNKAAGYSEVEMGIGINTGELVVGNVGSNKRTKYGVVGRNVNLASRIESYTVGGQILISKSTEQACDNMLHISKNIEVIPKGMQSPITVSEVVGMNGHFNIHLPERQVPHWQPLEPTLQVTFYILEGKYNSDEGYAGKIVRLAERIAVLRSQRKCRNLTNIKLTLFDVQGTKISSEIYAKVTEIISAKSEKIEAEFKITFTSVPPKAKQFLSSLLTDASCDTIAHA